MLVGGAELSAEDLAWLETEARRPNATRSGVARGLCARKGLVDGRGRPRVVTVRIDLVRHARSGKLALPAPAGPVVQRPRARERVVAKRRRVEATEVFGSLSVHRVNGPKDPWHAEWTRCLEEHHYLGAGPLCGAQLRYVAVVDGEVVAAAAFSSAARQVAARDEFIGWSLAARRRNRRLVISQSRFCVAVEAPNLASRVHGMLLRRVSEDWREAYGYQPVLVETYVDSERFEGTCYRAANWQLIGHTSGRGRQDRERRAAVSKKSVWVYPLAEEWRQKLCVEPVRVPDPDADWAETEWGSVDLGDKRRTRRLVAFGRARFARPTASIPLTCGNLAATKAAYRFLSHPNTDPDVLLSGHRESTIGRAVGEPVVLAIQDSTSLNYTHHPETKGLGPVSSHGAEATMGLRVHALLLATPAGVPLGVLDVQAWARDADDYGTAEDRRYTPTELKESRKWLRSYEVADQAARRLESTKVVVVGDREADMFDLLQAAESGEADLLVRAVHSRRIMNSDGGVEGCLWDCVRAEPSAGKLEVHVPKRDKQPARIAYLDLRFREVRISKPRDRRNKPSTVRLWAVAATEEQPPAGAEAIEWLLLTTLPVTSADSATEKVKWYVQRWLIEVFFRTLKTGCGIEKRQSKTAPSLMAALAIDVVVAWRVMMLVKLGREVPDMPCTAFFAEHEWKALYCFVHKTTVPPAEPPSMHEAVLMVAKLGGFLGRKSDGEPGAQTTWRGLERLTDISETCRLFFAQD